MIIVIILLLILIVFILSLSIFFLIKKSIYLSEKEKEYIKFVIQIFSEYGEDLGISSKEEQEKLIKELEKIKNKLK